jgi:hypothetical protein
MSTHWQLIWRFLFLLGAFAVAGSIDYEEAVRQAGSEGKKEIRFVCQQILEPQLAPRATAAGALVLTNFEADTEATLFRCVAES